MPFTSTVNPLWVWGVYNNAECTLIQSMWCLLDPLYTMISIFWWLFLIHPKVTIMEVSGGDDNDGSDNDSRDNSNPPPLARIISGATAEMSACIVCYPLNLIHNYRIARPGALQRYRRRHVQDNKGGGSFFSALTNWFLISHSAIISPDWISPPCCCRLFITSKLTLKFYVTILIAINFNSCRLR